MRRALIPLALLGLLAVPVPAAAQSYFGQNKVQYRTFAWQVIRTEHFDVHYYGDMRPAALDAARMAERSYARLSRILQHQFTERKPLILYASQSDFAQTNTTPYDLGEGTGGFTDFYRHRMVLPFTGAYDDFEHVLEHEMVHAFQYDVFARGRAGAGFQTIAQVNPPLWFMEGMAEYLSLGPVDPHTAMWMRDAAIHGKMPTIEQLTFDSRFFPYRFGHALWAYVAQKWGDEAVGGVLQGTLSGGIERAFQRVLGISLEQLSEEWIESVQNTYLPQIPGQERPRAAARQVLTSRRTGGQYNLAPQISPDGRQIAFLSERNFIFVDLWLADAQTGRNIRKLVGSTTDPNFESLRFINSTGTWSPDGRSFLFVAKSGGEDVLNILDVRRRRVIGRLRLGFAGITNPSYSPDGERIVFTGLRGGWSDLYVVQRDGQGLRQLTNDAYAELMPQWSPDGRAIAFATDRGPDTDLQILRFGTVKIALYWVDGDSITVLPSMDEGRNSNPVWAPDGRSIAFLSTRTGAANVFLYELGGDDVYQLTRAYTGITGITDLSPAISWSRQSDRMAVTYYENGAYNVYTIDNPRSLRRDPYRSDPRGAILLANAAAQPLRNEAALLGTLSRRPPASDAPLIGQPAQPVSGAQLPGPTPAPPPPSGGGQGAAAALGQSIYRGSGGLRPSDTVPGAAPGVAPAAPPLSVAALLDSATLELPDTTEFTLRRYRPKYAAAVVSRPTIGYTRDNFGRGFFGGAAVQLTDLLGDHAITLAGAVNGRLEEAQIYAAYANMQRRLNWQVGFAQDVFYYYRPSEYLQPPGDVNDYYVQPFDRWIARQLFAQANYPLNRFRRVELRAQTVNLSQATLSRIYVVDRATGALVDGYESISDEASKSYVMPGIGLVFDNSLFGWTSHLMGRRSRFDLSQAFGGYQYTQAVVDYRRYDMLAFPFTIASRLTMQGRFGRDENLFPMFLGTPDRVRGYTYASMLDNECSVANPTSLYICSELDQLIGSRMAVASVEFRFPLLRAGAFGFIPFGLPPVEGAVFYDAGLAWSRSSDVRWTRTSDDPPSVRAPVRSWGGSVRMNLFGFAILTLDYAVPLDRPMRRGGYWILSLMPPF